MLRMAEEQTRNSDLGQAPPTPLGQSKIRSKTVELIARIFFGASLAVLAVIALYLGGLYFAGFVTAGSVAAVREWHRMIEKPRFAWEFGFSAAAIMSGAALLIVWPDEPWAWFALGAGAFVNVLLAFVRNMPPVWQGLGALYVGCTTLSLVAIRNDVENGLWILLGAFLVIWADDTGALLTGKLIGGPKLVPRLSPNKTWAGFIGGAALAAVVEAIYVGWFGGNALLGATYAIGLAIVASAGDLFESWTKRMFNRKNSGSLIPGHGGVLDRIDSTLFVAPVVALLVMVLGVDTLFGAHP